MKPEQNNLQTNWLNEAKDLLDTEASKINGGMEASLDSGAAGGSDADFSAQLGELKAMFAEAQQRNIEMRKITTEEGTALKAAGKDVNPK